MGKAAVNRTIAFLLSAVLCISPALPVFAAEDLSDVRDGALSGTETPDAGNGADAAGLSGAVADTSYETESAGIFETIPDTSGERDLLPTVSESALTPVGTGDYTQLHDPVTKSGVTTWDTVWFGKYWQNDTNGDGYCFDEDITVSKTGTEYYDQYGRRLNNFTGNAGTYYADEKQPIKWRVLDIDEDGNALLLSDRLIDICEFDSEERAVVWSKAAVRSYLNGYEDYPHDSFIDMAFTNREKKAITESVQEITENTYTGHACIAETRDKIFLLSLEEALNPDYGFVKNEIDSTGAYHTDNDLTRSARFTRYVSDKPGYRGYYIGGINSWWLRTPGYYDKYSCYVDNQGAVHAFGITVNVNSICVRPALRINLSEESGVWSYAGSEDSNGNETVVVEDTEKPVISDGGVTTWNCVWFGDYWQKDTNGDGHCFSKNTRVTKSTEGYYFDQNGKMITGFDGNPGTYPADEKQPIKWRVLDIDEYGNALLLSDILPEVLEYNEDSREVTWEDSTSRSYLNGYNATYNGDFVDFSSKGFIDAAFNTDERKAISVSVIENKNNSVFGTNGGSKTKDRLFLLSMEEATNSKYGFTENKFTKKPSDDYEGPNCYTENSPSRAAKVTKYGYDKPGYNVQRSDTDCGRWYLRTPARDLKSAAAVDLYGSVRAIGYNVNLKIVLIRPALRLNLAQYSYLWSDAGTVSSDGTVNEVAPVRKVSGVSLPASQKDIILEAGESTVLKHTLKPENATEKSVTWKSSDSSVATVTSTGKVTGLKEGHVTITVRTKDGGYEAESKVWVRGINPGIDVVEGLDTEYLNMEMIPGETRRLIVNRYGVYVYGVRYRIISGKCITLKNGVVTAKNLKKGETSAVAEVEATHLDKTVKFTVNVKGAVPTITEGEKGKMIKAPKILKLTAGIDRKVTVTLPKALQGKSVTPDSTDYGILSLGAAKPDPNGMKVSFPVTPKAAGAAYIIWTADDGGGNKSQFVTKAIVKRPVDDISLHDDEGFDSLGVGEGRSLLIMLPKDNTDQKDLSFRVKGKNVKCSKSGFVAVTDPGAEGTVTIKAGKTAKEKEVKAGPYAPD
ncbi:MAG: Ig-like domain-containing protein, partial [Lachnospiraceae bacterium]|nr:Ig-like domain-containing protein [Lachnospiraceae bacterium]